MNIHVHIYIYVNLALYGIIPIISRPIGTCRFPTSLLKRYVATRRIKYTDREPLAL